MPEFHPAPGGGVRLVLDADEAHLLRRLAGELRVLIEGQSRDAGDPVTERLFPAAYEDPSEEKAYRELVSDDLEQEKLRALDAVTAALDTDGAEVTLTSDDLATWLASLTDLRLAIGTRLGVDEQRMSSEVDPDDPDAGALTVLHWLGWVQEGIVRTIGSGASGADE